MIKIKFMRPKFHLLSYGHTTQIKHYSSLTEDESS